jgi:GH15 family glucan-1,4-alpha-glucosidase
MYDLGLIGNCQASALVSRHGSVEWLCLPRPDSPPVFGRLLDPDGGHFSIAPVHPGSSSQRYHDATNVLATAHTDAQGNRFTVIDFFPRFEQMGRVYRPLMLIRRVIPLIGTPLVQVTVRPVLGWSKTPAEVVRGNSHLRFNGYDDQVRLTTTMPLTHLLGDGVIALTRPLEFALTWGVPVEDDLAAVAENFQRRTEDWWRTWVKHGATPLLFQHEVIRSALTLKLHCYEETGAVLAAVTTSLPETPGAVRNWDYRFCWLRDAYFTVSALHRLGHFRELEGILAFTLDVIHRENLERLRPVYRVDGTTPLPELECPGWRGHRDSQPVRDGNQAAEHVQNDVYGEMLLTLAPIYFDERFAHLRSPAYDQLLEVLATRCMATLDEPDAGLWELRDGWKPHAFSALMSWSALERYGRLAELGRIRAVPAVVTGWRDRAQAALMRSVADGVLWNAPGERVPDASSLLLAHVRHPDRALVERTVTTIGSQLAWNGDPTSGFLYRYRYQDDFGTPDHAFVICSFWHAEALARIGRAEQAQQVMERAMTSANHLGLIAEHWDPAKRQQHGNFPQCYSHVGLITAAFAVSPPWSTVL